MYHVPFVVEQTGDSKQGQPDDESDSVEDDGNLSNIIHMGERFYWHWNI